MAIKITYSFIFEMEAVEREMEFKTIEAFEKFEARNPEYEISSVKAYYECMSCDTHIFTDAYTEECPVCNRSRYFFLYSTEHDFKKYLEKIGA